MAPIMVRTAVAESGIGTITFAHPPLNILTQALLDDLRLRLALLADERTLRVLILEAGGGDFSAGADVAEHLPPRFPSMISGFLETVRAIAEFPLPVIAGVQGRCLGAGFEIAQAADLVVAGEGATFGQPEILLGVIAPAACVLLPERGAPGAAAELLFTGDPIDAARARDAGLVCRVVPDDAVRDEAMRLATRIARHSAVALRATKSALRRGRADRLAAALTATGTLYVNELMRSADAHEGLRAFLDKRKPEWVNA